MNPRILLRGDVKATGFANLWYWKEYMTTEQMRKCVTAL